VAACLIDAGAQAHPVQLAAYGRRGQLEQRLDEEPDAVNEADYRGDTPLIDAVRHRRAKIVALLLRREADIDRRNDQGETAGGIAAARGDRKIVALLRAGGPKAK
jgi:ankyrin repeat protein